MMIVVFPGADNHQWAAEMRFPGACWGGMLNCSPLDDGLGGCSLPGLRLNKAKCISYLKTLQASSDLKSLPLNLPFNYQSPHTTHLNSELALYLLTTLQPYSSLSLLYTPNFTLIPPTHTRTFIHSHLLRSANWTVYTHTHTVNWTEPFTRTLIRWTGLFTLTCTLLDYPHTQTELNYLLSLLITETL